MARTPPAKVNRRVLEWARKSAGVTIEEAARKAAVTVDRYLGWELGEPDDEYPSMAKLRSLANMFKRPLAMLFLPKPPAERDPMRDYRRPPGAAPAPLSRELRLQSRRPASTEVVCR